MNRPSEKPWKAIAAIAENRIIGNRGAIPWNLPEDFKWVKASTRDQVIAMGRKTFESIGRPLPHRENVVITRSRDAIPGCVVISSLQKLLEYKTDRDIWIFGGAEIYRQAFPYVRELFLTVVYGNFEGDAYFPPFEAFFDPPQVIRQEAAFEIRHYQAKA